MVRARQIREGLQQRVQHATNKLESLRGSLAKASKGNKETVARSTQRMPFIEIYQIPYDEHRAVRW